MSAPDPTKNIPRTFGALAECVRGERVYLSGPMAGVEDFATVFAGWERVLLAAGARSVSNPAHQSAGLSRRAYMAADIAALSHCDVIALMPGWTKSYGAQAEAAFAVACADIAVVHLLSEHIEEGRNHE